MSSPDSAAARGGRLMIRRVLVLGIGIDMIQYYWVLGSFSGIVLTLLNKPDFNTRQCRGMVL